MLFRSAPIINSCASLSKTFYGCTSLTNVNLPSDVESLENTFWNCSSLKEAPYIPNTATTMDRTFYGCSSLIVSPFIPSDATYIIGLFSGCSSLKSTSIIPSGIINFNYVFEGCSSIKDVYNIPSSVITLRNSFYSCSSLKAIHNFGVNTSSAFLESTFTDCTSLTNIYCPPFNFNPEASSSWKLWELTKGASSTSYLITNFDKSVAASGSVSSIGDYILYNSTDELLFSDDALTDAQRNNTLSSKLTYVYS